MTDNGLILEWNTDPWFSHINLSSVTMFSPAFSVSSSSLPAFLFVCLFVFCFVLFCFLAFFSPPSFRVFYNLLTVLSGCFNKRNTSFSLALLSIYFPFLLFSFSSFLFLSSLLFLFFTSPCIFLVRRPLPCRTTSDGPVATPKDVKHVKSVIFLAIRFLIWKFYPYLPVRNYTYIILWLMWNWNWA